MRARQPFNSCMDICLPLLPSESITSWYVRLARANAASLHELGSRIQGKTAHSATTLDLDVLSNRSFALALARATHTPAEVVELASLTNWTWLLSAEAPGRRWILAPSKMPGRHRQGRWTQACLACLAEDDAPFFRLYWRMAFVTECPVHHCALLDACPSCQGPLDFPRMDRGLPRPKRHFPLSKCPHCRVDWRIYGQRTQASEPTHWALQRSVLKGLSGKWTHCTGDTVWTSLVLDGFYRLANCFRTPLGQRVALRLSGAQVTSDTSEPIERLPADNRRALLRAVAAALVDWPHAFSEAAAREGLTSSHLTERCRPPWWLDRAIKERLDRAWYGPSSEEQAQARGVLKRRGVNATPWVLREWNQAVPRRLAFGGKTPSRRIRFGGHL
jgi:hypothetical protein